MIEGADEMLLKFEKFVKEVSSKIDHDYKKQELSTVANILNMHIQNIFNSKYDKSSFSMINFVKHLIAGWQYIDQ